MHGGVVASRKCPLSACQGVLPTQSSQGSTQGSQGSTRPSAADCLTCNDDCSARQPIWEDTNVYKVGPPHMPSMGYLTRRQYMHKSFIGILLLHMTNRQCTQPTVQSAACCYETKLDLDYDQIDFHAMTWI